MIVPEMGRGRVRRPAGSRLGDALFTPVQQRVLGLLFGQPERRFQSAEIIRLAGSGTGAAHRQLQRLAATGLALASRDGNQKYYQANRESPIYTELRGLVLKTVGVVEPLRDALAPLGERVRAAFVFGSVAKGSDDAQSDVDLLVIGEDLDYGNVYSALEDAELQLHRSVNPTVMSASEWTRKRARKDSFAARVAAQPKIFVIGSESVLG